MVSSYTAIEVLLMYVVYAGTTIYAYPMQGENVLILICPGVGAMQRVPPFANP